MMKTLLRIAAFIVGGNLLLVFALILTKATHGINDQDASFALAMVVYTLNRPAIWAFSWLGVASETWTLVVGGTLQWTAVSAVLALSIGAVRSRVAITAEPHGEARSGTSTRNAGKE